MQGWDDRYTLNSSDLSCTTRELTDLEQAKSDCDRARLTAWNDSTNECVFYRSICEASGLEWEMNK